MKNIAKLLLILCLSLTATLHSEERFKFGVSAPFSGILAEYGTAVRNGIELAQKDHPNTLSKIEIIYEDSRWDPKTALAAFNALRSAKKVSLLYNWGNPTSEAVAPVAEQYKLPTLAMSSDYSITKNRHYVIRTITAGQELGGELGDYLIASGKRNLGVLAAENSYIQGLYEGLSRTLSAKGGHIELIESVSMDQQDFKSIITRIKTKRYDAVGVFLISGQVSSFFKQCAALGVKFPTFGADFFGSKSEIEAAGSGIDGATFPDQGVTRAFREKYIQAYKNDIQIAFAANAYDVATMVGALFSAPGSSTLTADTIIAKIKTTKDLKGAHGKFTFEESKEYGPTLTTPIVIREVRGKEIVDLD